MMRSVRFSQRAGPTLLAITTVLSACSPAVEKIVPATPNEANAAQREDPPTVIVAEKKEGTRSSDGRYSTATNPFELDAKLTSIVNSLSGDSSAIVRGFFYRFHSGAGDGVKVEDMSGKPPRTAAEVAVSGGDCTDLSAFAVSILRVKKVRGGVLVVHFDKSPAGVDHMIPYVEIEGKKFILDLQTSVLGQTAQGKPTIIMTMSFDQAASMYHREFADYYRDKGMLVDAISAYSRAIEIFDGDAYAHQNRGVLYQKIGDMESAANDFKRAAEIDPSYKKYLKVGSYNEELNAGEKALKENNKPECVKHFTNALNSGEKIGQEERSTIQSYIDRCSSQ